MTKKKISFSKNRYVLPSLILVVFALCVGLSTYLFPSFYQYANDELRYQLSKLSPATYPTTTPQNTPNISPTENQFLQFCNRITNSLEKHMCIASVNNPSTPDFRDGIIDAVKKVWQPDAYIIAEVEGEDLIQDSNPYILLFASSNTKDFVSSTTGFGGPPQFHVFSAKDNYQPFGLPVNLSEISDSNPLPPFNTFEKNIHDPLDGKVKFSTVINPPNNNGSVAGAYLNATLYGKTFHASSITHITRNSKDKGIIFEDIFVSADATKPTAKAVFDKDGLLVSFETY